VFQDNTGFHVQLKHTASSCSQQNLDSTVDTAVLPPTSKQLNSYFNRLKLISKVISNTGLIVLELQLIFLRKVKKSFHN